MPVGRHGARADPLLQRLRLLGLLPSFDVLRRRRVLVELAIGPGGSRWGWARIWRCHRILFSVSVLMGEPGSRERRACDDQRQAQRYPAPKAQRFYTSAGCIPCLTWSGGGFVFRGRLGRGWLLGFR